MSNPTPPSKKKLSDNTYLRYTGLGFQVATAVALCIVAGHYTDRWMYTSKPYFTIILSFFGVIAACYWIIKEVTRDKE